MSDFCMELLGAAGVTKTQSSVSEVMELRGTSMHQETSFASSQIRQWENIYFFISFHLEVQDLNLFCLPSSAGRELLRIANHLDRDTLKAEEGMWFLIPKPTVCLKSYYYLILTQTLWYNNYDSHFIVEIEVWRNLLVTAELVTEHSRNSGLAESKIHILVVTTTALNWVSIALLISQNNHQSPSEFKLSTTGSPDFQLLLA